jgi:hypothetical protein
MSEYNRGCLSSIGQMSKNFQQHATVYNSFLLIIPNYISIE